MRFVIIGAVLLLSACTDEPRAVQALSDASLTPVSVGGYSWFGCGKDDSYATKFIATNASGKRVTGVVCAGLWFKGQTIRFD